jgi:hypothetical protein
MPAMMPVLAVASLMGGGISAYGQMQQGKETQQAQSYNAAIDEQQAQVIRQNAVLNEYRARKEQKIMTGAQIGGYAKSGVSVGTGSPLDVIADSLSNSELEIQIGNYNSEVEARNRESEARMKRMYGQSAATNAKYSAVGTLLSSATTSGYALSKEKIGS